MEYEYRRTTDEELRRLWEKNVADNPGDARWVRWAKEATDNNASGKAATFAVLAGGDPIGEGTLLFSPACSAIEGRTNLCDGSHTANVNGLRIRKSDEGKGHISALVREMERYAVSKGYTDLTIGADAIESRNLAIYLHWGYTEFVHAEVEDGLLVLYYRKRL